MRLPPLEVLVRHLPDEIIGVAGRRALVAMAASVPERIATIGCECRLSEDDSVDLGFSVAPGNGGRDALAGLIPDLKLERAAACDEAWRRVRDLARWWRDPASYLHAWSPFLFLELDAGAAKEFVSTPSVFVALDSRLEGAPGVAGGMRDAPELAAAREAAEQLGGLRRTDPIDNALERCFDSLPRGARVLHIGVMTSRRDKSVRLSVLLRKANLESYLQPLGAADAARAATKALDRLTGFSGEIQVDFDLMSARPKVGLGLRPQSPDEAGWSTLVHEVTCVSAGSSAKAEALLRWPATGPISIAGQDVRIHRELSHLKLVCSADAPLQAKAYFGIRPERATA